MDSSSSFSVRRVSSVPPANPYERAVANGSGVYEIRMRNAAPSRESAARDEFAGLDRLDREELDDDDTPGTPPVGVVHDIGVTHRYRRSA